MKRYHLAKLKGEPKELVITNDDGTVEVHELEEVFLARSYLTDGPAPGKVVTLPELKKKALKKRTMVSDGISRARGEEWKSEKPVKGEIVTPEKIAEIHRRRDENGENSATIARDLGLSIATVNRYYADAPVAA